jgi:RAQPRD family integrative conjugative element protein
MNKNFLLKTLSVTLFLTLLTNISIVLADTETENAMLTRVNQILNSLTPIINAAEQQQEENTRITFNYDCLRHDISLIKQGIEQKVTLSNIEPQKISPIKGDYIDNK